MALYAFGMMFFDSLSEVKEKIKNPRLVFLLSGLVALLVVIVLIAPVIGQNIEANYPVHPEYGNSIDVGVVLFTKYLVAFELAAIMLLVAMIGGIVLAGKKMNKSYSEMSEDDVDEEIRLEQMSSKEIK
jgi:NADH-quinone oxidoreductase subunit J